VVLLVLYRRRRCRGIRVAGEGGDLIISAVAMREFMQRLVAEFNELELLGVKLRRHHGLNDIAVRVNAVPGSNLKAVKDALKERIRAEASEKLGLDDLLGDIHIDVQRLSADERAIARKARKVHGGDPVRPAFAFDEALDETEDTPSGLRKPLPVSDHAE